MAAMEYLPVESAAEVKTGVNLELVFSWLRWLFNGWDSAPVPHCIKESVWLY